MTYVITQPCCNDASCVAVCPADCIHPAPDEPGYGSAEMLYVDPRTCIDCGACVDACPVDAIVADYELTPATEPYLELNALHYAGRTYAPREPATRAPRQPEGLPPLRVAVVGSGPSALYAAEALLGQRGLDVQVDVFERLPTPWGLVRAGVAPDHQTTKAVTKLFKRTSARKGFTFHLNVEVGTHVTNEELLAHHNAVLYATGAPAGRELGVPGEHLPGSASATDFVAWYNGHPDAAELAFDLDSPRAVVVGNGNVALDVARILLSDVADLARTDIADHALAALGGSRIEEVVVLGRRGPAQASFSTPELLALLALPGIDVVVEPDDLDPVQPGPDANAVVALKTRLLAARAGAGATPGRRRVVLRFLSAPQEVLGSERVEGLRIARTRLAPADDGGVLAEPTGQTDDLACGLVLRSVGYRARPLPGLPFDEARGVVPHVRGRVVGPDAAPVPGVYVAGWLKRGPSGVIGTNKACAQESVEALLEDHREGRLPAPPAGREALAALLDRRRPERLDGRAWRALDAHERGRGAAVGRPRVKVVRVPEMLEVVQQPHAAPVAGPGATPARAAE